VVAFAAPAHAAYRPLTPSSRAGSTGSTGSTGAQQAATTHAVLQKLQRVLQHDWRDRFQKVRGCCWGQGSACIQGVVGCTTARGAQGAGQPMPVCGQHLVPPCDDRHTAGAVGCAPFHARPPCLAPAHARCMQAHQDEEGAFVCSFLAAAAGDDDFLTVYMLQLIHRKPIVGDVW